MTIPKVSAEVSIYRSTASYMVGAHRQCLSAVVEPQADIGGIILGGVFGGIDVTIGEIVLTALILNAIDKAMPKNDF